MSPWLAVQARIAELMKVFHAEPNIKSEFSKFKF
jgi:hypothetical protein